MLAHARTNVVPVAVLDVWMPDMSGLNVTVEEFLWLAEVDFGAYVRDEPEHDKDPDPDRVDAERVDLNFRYYI